MDHFPSNASPDTQLYLRILGPSVEDLCMVFSRDYQLIIHEWRQLTHFKGYAIVSGYNPEVMDIEGFAINDGTYVSKVEPIDIE